MALALLDVVDTGKAGIRFRIDIGTNTQYELRVGRSVEEQDGSEWADDIYFKTAPKQSKATDPLFETAQEVELPLKFLESCESYAQLFSSKADGKSKAYSKVLPVTGAFALTSDTPLVHRFAPVISRR